MLRFVLTILWASFLIATIGVGITFSLIDPSELVILGNHLHASRTTIYSVSFLALWLLCTAAAVLACYLQRPDQTSTAPQDASGTA
jgi:hypothetical protein